MTDKQAPESRGTEVQLRDAVMRYGSAMKDVGAAVVAMPSEVNNCRRRAADALESVSALLATQRSTEPAVRGDAEALRAPKTAASGDLSAEDIAYPRDLFAALLHGNSPYAFYIFQWVPYQTDAKRWRLKMQHDVRTFDGREAFNVWPNGRSCGPFSDDEVEFIRISRSQFGEEWKDPRAAIAQTPEGKDEP